MSISAQTTPRPQSVNGTRAHWSCRTAPQPSYCISLNKAIFRALIPSLKALWDVWHWLVPWMELGLVLGWGLGDRPGGRGQPCAHSCRWLLSPWVLCCSRRRGPGSGHRRGGSRMALPGAEHRSYSSHSHPGPGGTHGDSGVAPRGSSMVAGTAGHTPAEVKPLLIQYRCSSG